MKKILFIFLSLCAFSLIVVKVYFYDRVHPNTIIAGVNVSYLKSAAAVIKLQNSFSHPQINLHWGTSQWLITPADISLTYHFGESVQSAGSTLIYSLSEEQLVGKIASISASINIPVANPEITISMNTVHITPGENGQMVDEPRFTSMVKSALARGQTELDIPIVALTPKLTNSQVEVLKKRAEILLNKVLVVKFETQNWNITSEQLISWLDPQGYKVSAIKVWAEELAAAVNRSPQNAYFKFEGSGRIKEFRPAKSGIKVETDNLVQDLLTGFYQLETNSQNIEISVPTTNTEPAVKLADINRLGIKELVGRGTSDFSGSIPNRVFNIGRAAATINGILIAPNEIFSFNKYIGDISAATGYKPAYVIKEGRTVLGDGGGVCQVSTTLFRAVLAAGLPIVERTAHAYRVHYYENDNQPGFDATIFSPSVDLKFKNDTGNYLLIQSIFDEKKNSLVFELYGTRDGRTVNLSKARVWDVSPPPPDLYQDDPTLDKGVVKQVDWSAWGTKAAFDWKVTRGNEVLQERTFYSNYRPWQAVYLRGTK